MKKLEQIKLLVEALQQEVERAQEYKALRERGGQHTNGHYPIFLNMVPSQYKELKWYCNNILAIINTEE